MISLFSAEWRHIAGTSNQGTLLFEEDLQKISILCSMFAESVTLLIPVLGNFTWCAHISDTCDREDILMAAIYGHLVGLVYQREGQKDYCFLRACCTVLDSSFISKAFG
jgi:hypothetical protein